MTGSRSRRRVTLSVARDLPFSSVAEHKETVREALDAALDHIEDEAPGLEVEWDTVSSGAQLVVATTPEDQMDALTDAAWRRGLLVDPLDDTDVGL